MTHSEAKLVRGVMVEASELTSPHTPNQNYIGMTGRRPDGYPRPAGVKWRKAGYGCLQRKPTTT